MKQANNLSSANATPPRVFNHKPDLIAQGARKAAPSESAHSIPSYDPNLFVNRQPEIKLVMDKVKALGLGEPVRLRTIVFWGYKGSGKTWLLRHITRELREAHFVKPVYIDLETYSESVDPEEAIEALYSRLARAIWGPDSQQASLYQRATDKWPAMTAPWLAKDLDALQQRYVLILLLDHVYESDRRFLEVLEDQLLARLAVQPRVLIVMTGRGQAYPWKTPELRLYVQDYHLKPFDLQGYTEEQLQLQKKDAAVRAASIHQMSGGYPLANILLADRPTTVQAMQETVNALLDQVPDEEASWIEALSVLRAFDEEHIPPLLAAYSEDASLATLPYRQVRQVRDRLLHTRLVRWQEQVGGWAVDEAIRPLLEEYLLQARPGAWRRLHCAAYRLYKDWMQRYPDEAQRWQQEANYHRERLNTAGYNSDLCE